MAIALDASTTGAKGTARTDTTITAPGTVTNGNILIATVVTSVAGAGGPGNIPTPPSGFTRVGSNQQYSSGGFTTNLGLWWKRCSSESGNYTFTHDSSDCQGWMGSYSGCLAAGTPVGTPSANSGTGATYTYTGVTTGSNGSWIIGWATDFNWGAGLTPSGGMTERLDGNAYLQDELRSSAGATGNRTMTNSNGAGDSWLTGLVELIIATSGGIPNKAISINQAVRRAAFW